MAKKNLSSKILIDSYVSIAFVAISLIILLCDLFLSKGKIAAFLASPVLAPENNINQFIFFHLSSYYK